MAVRQHACLAQVRFFFCSLARRFCILKEDEQLFHKAVHTVQQGEFLMLDKTLKAHLIEMIASNFTLPQIDELGSLFHPNYTSHERLGIDNHITAPLRKSADALVDFCIEKGCDDELVKVIIEMDGKKMMGKTITIPQLEEFLVELAHYGFIYDAKKRKLRKTKDDPLDMPNWGSLREGREYEMTLLSADIVNNSELVSQFGMKKMEKMYFHLWNFLRRVLSTYGGRIWNWAGDGGIIAFTFKKHAIRAVQYALEVQSLVPVFNTDPDNPIPEDIQLRIGVDSGMVKYSEDTGRIVSETINFAAHLEKQFTQPGGIAVSGTVMEQLPEKIQAIFCNQDNFEDRDVYYKCIPGLRQEAVSKPNRG
jgi:class 3 adenylate cyclase